jgi:hypothetical protein
MKRAPLTDCVGGDRFFSEVMLLTILKDSLTSISIIFQRESKVYCTMIVSFDHDNARIEAALTLVLI